MPFLRSGAQTVNARAQVGSEHDTGGTRWLKDGDLPPVFGG
jgi:hypothetical protein